MRTIDARIALNMKPSAFYNLKNRLHIKTCDGVMEDADFELMKQQHEKDLQMSAGRPLIYYRICVNRGYGWFVEHAGLRKYEAAQLIAKYEEEGICALMKPCN